MSMPLPLSALPAALTEMEARRLTECESRIEQGIAVFLEVGNALLEIRDSRLYRQQYPTFEAYCKERWGMKRPRAYELMDAATVVKNVSEISDIVPQKEAHTAPLTRLEPEVQREVWREVTETTPADKITAKAVEEKAKAAEPLNETVQAIKAEINAPSAPLFPPSPAIAGAAQQVASGVVSLVDAARKVRQAVESIPLPAVVPLHDLEGIDPALYPRATELQGAIRRLAEFCRKHDPQAIASAFKAHEKPGLKTNIATVDGWIACFSECL